MVTFEMSENAYRLSEDDARVAVAYSSVPTFQRSLTERLMNNLIMRGPLIVGPSIIEGVSVHELTAELRQSTPELFEYSLPSDYRPVLIGAFTRGANSHDRQLPPILSGLCLPQVRSIASFALEVIDG